MNNSEEIKPKKKTGIFVLFGESFRSGEQGTRIRGLQTSYQAQINACNSHIEFMNHFNDIDWKVIILSYTTPYTNQINSIYKPIYSYYYDHPIGYHNLFEVSKKIIISSKIAYDFVFFSRIDLEFKPLFKTIFDPSWDTIRYPFICWKKDSITRQGCPRVSDTMLFIPKKYNITFITLNHDSWYELCMNHFGYSCIDVMINTYHDSDTSKDYNPLYTIVNRKQTDTWHSSNDIFDKKQHFMENHKLFLEVAPNRRMLSPYW